MTNQPLDDIFKEEEISIETTEVKRLRVTFEWIISFSVLFWGISLVQHFGSDWVVMLKGILLIGLFTTLISTVLSLVFALFEYKNFSFLTRFYHLWLLLMSFSNGLTILIALWFILK
ncbi:MAG: ABC-type phosphate/phosphonate transport system permease subunit [Saprospiraceae bacterium]|jgi:ABC-type phosphate/phosphonate transport system permease subunit|tara:strand:- start:4562 stop:4912 length:351 start_codon:yes stop_codon:yes gene_type:complete